VPLRVTKTLILFALLFFISLVQSQAAAQTSSPVLITGIVTDSNGSTINGATVSLTRDHQTVRTTTTDNEGRFEFTTLETTKLLVEVSSIGFASAEIQLSSKTTFPIKIVLTPQSVAAQVTVAATRTTTRLDETAASVVLLNSADLNTTAAATLDDTLRQVAGFSLFRRSGSRTANPTSQGVSLRATGASGASRALVLADGVPLNDPFGGWVYWDRVPRESIGEVEVLLGSSSHLYGSAALGGVIDLGTKTLNGNTVSFAASYGNETTPNASLFAAGTRDGWAGSIAAETFWTDGYILVPEPKASLIDTPATRRDAVINLHW
jgi:outer membrane receptor for Fe3+-dicitrate